MIALHGDKSSELEGEFQRSVRNCGNVLDGILLLHPASHELCLSSFRCLHRRRGEEISGVRPVFCSV